MHHLHTVQALHALEKLPHQLLNFFSEKDTSA
jgi:hypothetical protein